LLLQLELFAVLATHPPPLISLTLNNVIAMPHKIYTMEAFQNIFRSLATLSISVVSDQGDGAYQQAPLFDFWEIGIPSILQSAARLTSLTVRSDQLVGFRPAAPLATVHSPRSCCTTSS
jgi:hypothetical protein